MPDMPDHDKILIIKLGALGDFFQALGPMKAIRAHHPDAHITLLTTKPFESFANETSYFDAIILDEKPKWYELPKLKALRGTLNGGGYGRVYDLQNNDRTNGYFKLLTAPKPEWVGVARGASHRNISPERTAGHAFDGHVQTLGLAGITDIDVDTLEWMTADTSAFALNKPTILFVPGSAPQHPYKRWPAEHYAQVAAELTQNGYDVAVLGTDVETDIAQTIKAACPAVHDLTGKTTLHQIVTLARHATGAIGSDTGPMHLIGATGCPSLITFSRHSNPIRHAPKGAHVHVIQELDLADLSPSTVLGKLPFSRSASEGAA